MLIIEENASISKVTTVIDKETLYDLLSYTETTVLPQYEGKLASIKKSAFDRRSNSFGTGLVPFIKKKLEAEGNTVKVRAMKESTKSYLEFTKDISLKGIELEDYQKKILNLVEEKRTGVIEAPTAAGKTIIIAGIIKKFNIPRTIIIVPTSDIARNTIRELQKLLGMKIGLFGDGKKELKRITVMLYQSMRKIPNLVELGKHCDLIIIDECHLAIDAIEEILKNFHSTWYRYGLTATPISSARKSKWFHLTSQLGEKIITVTDKQAKKRVAPVNAYMFKFYCEPENIDYNLYRENVLLNKERCIFLLKMVRWAFNKKNIQSCLLLVDEYEQAKMLKRLARNLLEIKPEIAWSKLKGEDLEDIKERLNNRKLKFCIATPVFSTGTNIPNVDCVVLGSARKSITNTKQKIGRGRRKTEIKDELLLLDIYEQIGKHDKYFIKYSERRKNIYSRKKWLKEIYEGSELN